MFNHMIYYKYLKHSDGNIVAIKIQRSFQKQNKGVLIKKIKRDYEPWYACFF